MITTGYLRLELRTRSEREVAGESDKPFRVSREPLIRVEILADPKD